MPQELPIFQVDAFTSRAFAGNPAAVCPLDDWLPEATMQAIAAENNLSETAFFVRRERDYDLRWFTPLAEVDLCGHATLASAYVIATQLAPDTAQMVFHTRSGPLTVTRDGARFTLDLPAQPVDEVAPEPAVAEALGMAPESLWRANKAMAVLADEAAVRAADPDLAKVAALPGDGLLITAPGADCDFVSRYFAPHVGIPEDPVTGSTHCMLTPFWARRLGKPRMSARQLSRRGGELAVEDRGARILVAGEVAPYLQGTIQI